MKKKLIGIINLFFFFMPMVMWSMEAEKVGVVERASEKEQEEYEKYLRCFQDPYFSGNRRQTTTPKRNTRKAKAATSLPEDVCLQNLVKKDPHFFLVTLNKCFMQWGFIESQPGDISQEYGKYLQIKNIAEFIAQEKIREFKKNFVVAVVGSFILGGIVFLGLERLYHSMRS